MEQVEKRGDWYLFDPHEVKEVMGFSLEDHYDETRGAGSFRDKYEECIQNNDLSKTKVPAIEIFKRILKSQLESGTPFMFYRDEVNRMNANNHKGMIYSSNLCTEITQNQSPTIQISRKIENEDEVVITKKSGDFVTCNLSSINLGTVVPRGLLERVTKIQVRMLDNVIDVNHLPVEQAEITNHRYRAVGLGTFGLHHLLALEGVEWESQEAVDYNDKLYENIAYYTIKASAELAEEKGSYRYYEGSDWHTGAYFTKRGYLDNARTEPDGNTERWALLQNKVMETGIRNGYLMATAPTGSISIIANSTAGIDPVFDTYYQEEKRDYRIPTTPPDLNLKTYQYYNRSAYKVDQRWSVRQNSARQKHIDQAISFNIYVPSDIRASILLDLHLQAWKERVKTTYYVRSTADDIEDCEWCQ